MIDRPFSQSCLFFHWIPSVLIMSAVQNCLNRYLLFPKIWGSFIFNFHGQLQHIRVIRIILSVCAYAYFFIYEKPPPYIDFQYIMACAECFLICTSAGMLLRATWRIEDFRVSLELMESVSVFFNGAEIKLILWPSIISNIVIITAVSYRAYKFSKPPLQYLSNLQILLLLNAFTDEFATMLLLLRFLSEALNAHLGNIINRENLVSLLKSQNMLCSAVRRINNLYSVQILFVMALSLFCSISFTYLLIREIFHSEFDSLTILLWVITFLQQSVKIILPASFLTNSVI